MSATRHLIPLPCMRNRPLRPRHPAVCGHTLSMLATASVTRAFEPDDLAKVEQELREVWDEMTRALLEDRFPTSPGRLCDWCSFKDRCPAFVDPTEPDSGPESDIEAMVQQQELRRRPKSSRTGR